MNYHKEAASPRLLLVPSPSHVATMVDVDMKPAAEVADTTTASTGLKKDPITPKELVLTLLRHNLNLIVRSVIHLEPRFAARAIRTVSSTRKLCHLHPDVLARVVEEGTEKGEFISSAYKTDRS